jgi:glutamate decarboxylase
MPPNREDLVIQRILVRHGFTREMAETLLKEMQSILADFARRGSEEPESQLAGAGASAHDHSGR